MSQEIHQKLDNISKTICSLRDVGDSVFDELYSKVSKLLVQVEIQKGLNEIARTIRDGSALPVRRINYNIKKLSDNDEACQIRWSALRKLNCPQIIFSTMAFSGLVSLADEQFEYLVENVPNYIKVQELPCDWIARDQIRKVVAGTPRRESTQPFLQDYHGLEIKLSQDSHSNAKKDKTSARKCQRLEGKHTPSTSGINEGDGGGRKRKRGTSQERWPSASDGRNGVIRAGSIETTEAPAGVNLQTGNASSLDSSLSQTSIGLIHDQGGANGKTSPGDANFRAASQGQGARQVEASETNIAMMTEVDKLERTLGGYLFKGMDASRMRTREKDGGMMRFTDTVRLHFAYHKGEDFKLELWLCSSIGKAISQAKMRSVEDLRSMLGNYLFNAMKASNWRKEEEKKGISECTGAIDVSCPNADDGSDCKVEVMLCFVTGKDVYAEIYPS